jgi:hypothetical protein
LAPTLELSPGLQNCPKDTLVPKVKLGPGLQNCPKDKPTWGLEIAFIVIDDSLHVDYSKGTDDF